MGLSTLLAYLSQEALLATVHSQRSASHLVQQLTMGFAMPHKVQLQIVSSIASVLNALLGSLTFSPALHPSRLASIVVAASRPKRAHLNAERVLKDDSLQLILAIPVVAS